MNITLRKASALTSLVGSRLGLALLLASPATAAEFEPRIRLGISYTDNLTLAPSEEQDETIYRGEPGFTLTHETQRFELDADYLLQALRYADLGKSDVYHQYDLQAVFEVLSENLFIDFGGNRSQSILDPQLAIPQSNVPVTANRQDRDEYFVSPSFQYEFGRKVIIRSSYKNSWIDYSEDSALSSDNRDFELSLDNLGEGSGITWGLRYDWQRSEYDEGIPWENQRATAQLGHWLNSRTRFFASGGRESAWDQPLDPALDDDFWEAGFSHNAGARLQAEFAVGKRSFGSSWRGDIEWTFNRGSTQLSYQETPTTQARNPFIRSALGGALTIQDFLSRPGSAERFVSERLDWSVNFALRRTSLSFAVFDEGRTNRTTASGEALPTEDQRGIDFSLSYELGPKTDIRVSASFADREFEQSENGELIRGLMAVDYRLGIRTSLSLEYEYAEEDGGADSFVRDYVAHVISLFLTRSF